VSEPEPAAGSEQELSARRTSFGAAADDYSAGRPHYPRQSLQWCLPPEATTVLDLGAGTGLLAGGLLGLGLDVVAVEPLAEMRALIPAAATALDGSAEAIPVDDASADAVFVGQAWHWFDEASALAETRRVLRPGGRLALMWNLLDTADPVTLAVADIIDATYERTDMALDHTPPIDDPGRFGPAELRRESHVEAYDIGRLEQLARSRSQAIILEPAERQELLGRLRAIAPAGSFDLHWVCEAWRATAI
jgi:SAM-dependent methyltransferase